MEKLSKSPVKQLEKIFDALLSLEKEKEDIKIEQENILLTAKKDGFEPKAIVGILRLLKKDKEKEKEMKRILREYANSLKLEELKEII